MTRKEGFNMTPNGHDYSKEYGLHKYSDDPHHTQDCQHGCGCWAGPARSGGPVGLDPLGGECPNNPKSGERLSGNADYEIVVERRISALETRVYNAEQLLKQVEPGEIDLAKELQKTKKQLFEEQQRTKRAAEVLVPPQPEEVLSETK